MNSIIVKTIRSDSIYKKIMEAPTEKKDDIFRYELMQPFEKKFAMYHCPLKAAQPGGFDVVMASGMVGHLTPQKIDASIESELTLLEDNDFWNRCQHSIETSFSFQKKRNTLACQFSTVEKYCLALQVCSFRQKLRLKQNDMLLFYKIYL